MTGVASSSGTSRNSKHTLKCCETTTNARHLMTVQPDDAACVEGCVLRCSYKFILIPPVHLTIDTVSVVICVNKSLR